MTTATRAKRFLAAAVLGASAGPVWAQGFGGPGDPAAQQVSASQLFQGLSIEVAPVPPPTAAEPAGGIRWRSELTSAYAEATGQGKPLVIFLSNDRCETCRGVCKDSETVARSFADPRLAATADRAVFLRLDFGRLNAEEQGVFKSLEIKTLPTVVLVDTRGGRLVLVGQLVGAFEADALVARFSDLMTRFAEGPSQATAAPPPPPAAPPAPTYGTPAAQAPSRLFTPESLPGFLTGLGFEVKSVTTSDGVPVGVVKARRGDWTLNFTATFSKNGEILWLAAPLGRPLPADADLSATALAGLLLSNAEIGPIHFSINRSDRRIYLNFPVTNVGLTPESCRDRIEAFLDEIMKTGDLWTAAATPPASQPRPVARY